MNCGIQVCPPYWARRDSRGIIYLNSSVGQSKRFLIFVSGVQISLGVPLRVATAFKCESQTRQRGRLAQLVRARSCLVMGSIPILSSSLMYRESRFIRVIGQVVRHFPFKEDIAWVQIPHDPPSWPVSQVVKTEAFHVSSVGSNPARVTIYHPFQADISFVYRIVPHQLLRIYLCIISFHL